MKLKVFSVRDSKIGEFTRPWFARASGEAERMFKDHVNEKDSTPGKHPEDFALFELGEFDPEQGTFTNLVQPHPLGLAAIFKEQQ